MKKILKYDIMILCQGIRNTSNTRKGREETRDSRRDGHLFWKLISDGSDAS